jgi:hypothetical protein
MKPKSLLPELPVSANSGREDEVFSDGIERAKDDSASIVETQNCNGSIESRYDNDILDFRFDSKDNEEKGRRDDADRLCNDTYEAPEKNVELSNDADLFFKNYDTNGSIGGSKLLPGINLISKLRIQILLISSSTITWTAISSGPSSVRLISRKTSTSMHMGEMIPREMMKTDWLTSNSSRVMENWPRNLKLNTMLRSLFLLTRTV